MKTCTTCKETKPYDDFRVKRRNKNGTIQYQSKCIDCNKEYQRQHYKKNKDTYRRKAREWDKQYKKEVYQLLMTEAANGCVKCGEKDFRCLQFNHIDRNTKVAAISTMTSNNRPLSLIKEELKKCEVVCANCHMKITAKQFDWYVSVHEDESLL